MSRIVGLLILAKIVAISVAAEMIQSVAANVVAEISVVSDKTYPNPFIDVVLDAIVTEPDGTRKCVPGFWAGGSRWSFRFAAGNPGSYTWTLCCSDTGNSKLHGVTGRIEIVPYRGTNALYQHGPIRVAEDFRHFAHADGTPFIWLADTWWKNLCKRLTWEGFQELAADRKSKGFSAIQIVCGPYPDEEMMEVAWENEGGKPYETRDFTVVNPAYFDFSDRRIAHLVDVGMVPVIVGGWGRPQGGGKSTLDQVGLEGFKRHWRNLIARYGAYPVVWIVGGEARDAYGPWSELAKHVKATDPYQRLLTYHSPDHPRQAINDNAVFDFDMIGIGHDGYATAARSLDLLKSCMSHEPVRPAIVGEACYEGHMQTNFQDLQRYLFWSSVLSGASGHTYGAAGIWHASVEGDPGITPVYDFTTWKEGMDYPGSAQVGLGKKLMEKYPWSRFQPHPEWAPGCFASGIPGEVRVTYVPRRTIYDWSGPTVRNLEPTVDWHAYFFDPASGRTFDRGNIKANARGGNAAASSTEFNLDLPSPQDWVLVFERID